MDVNFSMSTVITLWRIDQKEMTQEESCKDYYI